MNTQGDESKIYERDSIDATRLTAFCAARTRVCEVTGCWIWTGQKRTKSHRERFRDERGRMMINGRVQYAYRVLWSLANAQPFPSGKIALHTCDTPECVNPDHVRPGTQAENGNDAAVRGRVKSRLSDEQVASIVRVANQHQGASRAEIARRIGDPGITRYNVRDVLKFGYGVRRVMARASSAANLAS